LDNLPYLKQANTLIIRGSEVGKRKTQFLFKRSKMKNDMYKVAEIDLIFKNCQQHTEIFEACKVFKQLHIDGHLSNLNFRAASQYSVLRFKELTQK